MDSSELSPCAPRPTAAGPCGTAVVVEGREVALLAVQEGADGAVELDLEALVLLVVELQGQWRYARIEEVLRIAQYPDFMGHPKNALYALPRNPPSLCPSCLGHIRFQKVIAK